MPGAVDDEETSLGELSAGGGEAVVIGVPPGGQIGRYIVLDELGSGGMGVVYKAWDPALERPVALKVMAAGRYAGQRQIDRFFGEARVIARLDDPTLVSIYDVGLVGGCPYFTMEFVDGVTLAARVGAGGPMPPTEAAALAAAIARGLHHAHAQGVVHRDVKPANVVIDREGAPRVIDFGIARLLESSDAQTRTGQVLGTPAYMAPEQAMGRLDAIGPRTDVYGIAGTLFAAVTGHRPTAVSPDASLGDRDAMPGELYAICHRALASDPEARYASAEALADDLERFLRGEPVDASLPGPARRFRWWLRRRLAAMGTMALVSVLGLGAIAGWQAWREAQRVRVEAAERARREATAADRLAEARIEAAALRRAGDPAGAERVEREAALRLDVQGSRALTRFHLDRAALAAARGESRQAMRAVTTAYSVAEAADDRVAAMTALGRLFIDRRDAPALGTLVATLDRRSPERRAEWAGLRLHDDVFSGRLIEAAASPAAAESGWRPMLRALGRGTPTAHVQSVAARTEAGVYGLTLADVNGDGRPEAWTGERLLDLGDPRLPALDWPAPPADLPPKAQFAPVPGMPGLFYSVGLGPSERLLRPDGDGWRAVGELPPLHFEGVRAADLDRDGRPEVYAFAPQRLRGLPPAADGLGPMVVADPAFDATWPFGLSIEVADLGEPVVLVGTTGWSAYDLRIYRGDGGGRLIPAARRQVGAVRVVAGLPDRGGRRLVAFATETDRVDRRYFHPELGPPLPDGLHVFEWTAAGLVPRWHMPQAADGREILRIHAGDLDGDGLTDLVALAAVAWGERIGLVMRGLPDGWAAPLPLLGFQPLAVVDVDGDGDDELVAGHVETGRIWVLGAGAEPIPRLASPPPVAAPVSPADDLVALGLLEDGLEALRREVMLGHAPAAAARRAAAIAERLDRPAEAAALHLRAADDPALAADALRAAADAWRDARRPADERAALARLVALPGLDPAAAAEARDRLAQVDAELAARLVVDFARPLDPRWRIAEPDRLRRDPQGALVVHCDPVGELARLPLRRIGDRVGVELTVSTSRVELGGALEVALVATPADGAEADLVQIVDSGWGGGGIAQQRVFARVDGPRQFVVFDEVIGSTAGRPFTVHMSYDLSTGEAMIVDRATGRRDVRRHPVERFAGLRDLALVIGYDGAPHGRSPMIEARVERLALHGLALAGGADDPPSRRAARALVDGRPDRALRALEDQPEPLLRALALYDAGARDAADRIVRARLAAAADPDPPLDRFLRGRLRRAPLHMAPLIREVWGARADDLFFRTFGYGFAKHPDDPEFVRAAAAVLLGAGDDLADAARVDPHLRLQLRLARAQMYRVAADPGGARADLAACEALLRALPPAAADRALERGWLWTDVRVERAVVDALVDPDAAADAVRAALLGSPSPAITADRIRAEDGLRHLRGHPVWGEVEAAASW